MNKFHRALEEDTHNNCNPEKTEPQSRTLDIINNWEKIRISEQQKVRQLAIISPRNDRNRHYFPKKRRFTPLPFHGTTEKNPVFGRLYAFILEKFRTKVRPGQRQLFSETYNILKQQKPLYRLIPHCVTKIFWKKILYTLLVHRRFLENIKFSDKERFPSTFTKLHELSAVRGHKTRKFCR